MKTILAALLLLVISACGSIKVDDYESAQPKLDMKAFFDGELKAYGILQNRKGKVTRKFSADIIAKWDGNTGTLDETFYFDDGETSKRFWMLKLDQDRLTGSAGDVVGEASGRVAGNALRWKYMLQVPYKKGNINVVIDDWLYLVTENRLINKSKLKKYGFKVGELTLVIEKIENN